MYDELIKEFLKHELQNYKHVENSLKDYFRLLEFNQDKIISELGKILFIYNQDNGKLIMNSYDLKRESKKFFKLLHEVLKKEGEVEEKYIMHILNDICNNKNKNLNKIYSASLNFNIQLLNQKEIDKIIKKKIMGETWSNRLWNNKKELEKILKKEVKRLLNGNNTVSNTYKSIQKTFNQNKYNVKRLVETETAKCQNEIHEVFCVNNDIDKMMYVATLDNRTCEVCAKYDGCIFKTNDSNKPILPLHPLDRCTYIGLPTGEYKPTKRYDNEKKYNVKYRKLMR